MNDKTIINIITAEIAIQIQNRFLSTSTKLKILTIENTSKTKDNG
jgi:hypothetical protein